MIDNQEFFVSSLTNELIYIKLFKSFCLNIQLAFLEKNREYSVTAEEFRIEFEALNIRLLKYANYNIYGPVLENELLVTRFSLGTIEKTEKLFKVNLPIELTLEQLKLQPAQIEEPTQEALNEIIEINERTVVLCKNFKSFLTDIFEKEVAGELFSYSYPFLIRRMVEEIDLYLLVLERIINRLPSDPSFVIDYEFRTINLFKSFAMFIRSFTDPSREDIIHIAQSFIIEYQHLLNDYSTADLSPESQRRLTAKSKKIVDRFAEFFVNVLTDLLNNDVYLIVEPVLIDNMYRTIKIGQYFMFLTKEKIAGNI